MVAAAAATELQKKKKKMEYVDKTLDTVTASGWCLQWINNGCLTPMKSLTKKLPADGRWCCGGVIF